MTYDSEDAVLPLGPDYPAPEHEEPEVFSAPDYRMIGFTIAGENAIECNQCGAVLRESSAFLHTHFHEAVSRPRMVV